MKNHTGMSFAGDLAPLVMARSLPRVMVCNLECAFSDEKVVSGKAYTSIVDRKCVDKLRGLGIPALSLANNHVNDAGNFSETIGLLKRRFPEIQFFGTVENPCAHFGVNGEEMVVIGCLEPCRSRGSLIFRQEDVSGLIRKLRSEKAGRGGLKIYVYPHWGMEGEYTRWPSPAQQRLAHEWIDVGADGVFGSHSHVFQGREDYKGKPIYYSLGNFFFPHPESKLYAGTHEGLSVEIREGKCVERYHHFEDDGTVVSVGGQEAVMQKISEPLMVWTTWKWAKRIGGFNIRKNMASWRIRLWKNLIKTLPKFVIWQFLPKTILFRVAALCSKEDSVCR